MPLPSTFKINVKPTDVQSIDKFERAKSSNTTIGLNHNFTDGRSSQNINRALAQQQLFIRPSHVVDSKISTPVSQARKDGVVVKSSIKIPIKRNLVQTSQTCKVGSKVAQVNYDDVQTTVFQTKLPVKLVKGLPWSLYTEDSNEDSRSSLFKNLVDERSKANQNCQRLVPLPKNFKLVKASPQTIAKLEGSWKLTEGSLNNELQELNANFKGQAENDYSLSIIEDHGFASKQSIKTPAPSHASCTSTMPNLEANGICNYEKCFNNYFNFHLQYQERKNRIERSQILNMWTQKPARMNCTIQVLLDLFYSERYIYSMIFVTKNVIVKGRHKRKNIL